MAAEGGVDLEIADRTSEVCLDLAEPAEHAVQFYRDPRFLIDTALRFVAGGLERGEGAVVIATAEHLASIRFGLSARGLAPSERLVLCDAEELLAEVLVEGRPMAERLVPALHGLLQRARAGEPERRLRVHAELADLLWRRRRVEAVIELEELCGELVLRRGVRMLCAYCLTAMARAEYQVTFDAICASHASVAPTEAWRDMLEPAGRRSLASLEQRAAALEGELLRREWAKELSSELQRTSGALGGLLSEREAAAEVVRVGLAALGGRAGGVWLLDAAGSELELVHEEGLPAGAVARVGRLPASTAHLRQEPLFADPEAPPPPREPSPAELQLLTEVEGPVALLPLGSDGSWQGTLLVQARSLEPEERSFLTLLAQSCSQAIERARAWTRERQAREQAEAAHRETLRLFELADAVGRAQDVAELYEPALEGLLGMLRVERAALLLVDGDGAMRFKAWRGLSDAQRSVLEGHSPWVAGEVDPRPVLVSDVESEPGWEPLRRLGLHALGFVPLVNQRQLLGKLLLCADSSRRFSEREVQLARSIAAQVSQAVARVRLLERERIALDAAESAQQRTTFLLQASVLLASSLEWKETLVALADLAVPGVADWCAIDVGEGDQLACLAIAHGDPTRVELARRLRQEHPPDSGDANAPAAVVRSGEPRLIGEIGGDALPSLTPTDHQAFLARLGIRSALIVPMSARGRTFGTITLATDGARRFGVNDLELAELLGRRAGIAIDNARLYAEAQSATRSREEILAVVSHDLRNPLGAVLTGAAGLLNTEISERKGPRIRKSVETIHRAGERMARLINDLVDFASIQSGRLGIERGDCLVAEMIESALEMFLPLAEERELRVETVIPPDRPVHCDRDRVIQVLANLIANALKVTAAGGLIRVGAAERGGALVFFVEDTGPGIGPDDLPRLFERYWRGKASYKGTGLGLTIARGIVEAHGGRIWAESQVGVGSTFSFTLSPGKEGS